MCVTKAWRNSGGRVLQDGVQTCGGGGGGGHIMVIYYTQSELDVKKM